MRHVMKAKQALLGAVCAMGMLAAPAAFAGADEDNLQAMYMLRASQSLCDFAMSEAEAAKLKKAATFLEEKLKYDAAKADAFFKRVKDAVDEQKADLCKKDGEWAKTYASALAGLPE
jgi:hypothetical protein